MLVNRKVVNYVGLRFCFLLLFLCIKYRHQQEPLNTDSWYFCVLPHQGGGCGLMTRTRKFEDIVKGMNYVSAELTTQWKTSNFISNTESTLFRSVL